MGELIDSKTFGLSGKTVIERIGSNHFAIVISRKSRVIMADGEKILKKAEKIKQKSPTATVSLRLSAPLCSKTEKFLEENNIKILR